VRMKFLPLMAVAVLLTSVLVVHSVRAQRADTMLPEQSEAKGKQILNDLINAFGGPGYTEVKEIECRGRRALFGHSGDLVGYIEFANFRRLPDKDRTEYTAKGHNTLLASLIGLDGLDFTHGGIVITLYNGDQGWTFDRSGVSELPVASVSEFQEQTRRTIDNLLRFRLKEPGMTIRYGGSDTVDLKQIDWVEIADADGRLFRLAVDRSTHLLVRSVVSTQDQENQQVNDDVVIYTNYQLLESVWVPLQVTREHNGRRTAQVFLASCRFNPRLPDNLFSKATLQKGGSESVLKKAKN
jgi:hypothetical protein